jgi:hypothetical protein
VNTPIVLGSFAVILVASALKLVGVPTVALGVGLLALVASGGAALVVARLGGISPIAGGRSTRVIEEAPA